MDPPALHFCSDGDIPSGSPADDHRRVQQQRSPRLGGGDRRTLPAVANRKEESCRHGAGPSGPQPTAVRQPARGSISRLYVIQLHQRRRYDVAAAVSDDQKRRPGHGCRNGVLRRRAAHQNRRFFCYGRIKTGMDHMAGSCSRRSGEGCGTDGNRHVEHTGQHALPDSGLRFIQRSDKRL